MHCKNMCTGAGGFVHALCVYGEGLCTVNTSARGFVHVLCVIRGGSVNCKHKYRGVCACVVRHTRRVCEL